MMIKWVTGLATIAALAWLASTLDDADTRPPALRSAPTDQVLRTVKPAVGKARAFSVAEIRWCMIEHIRLETIQPRLATRRAIGRYNELAADYKRRCNGYTYLRSDLEEARSGIDGARTQIVAAALDDIQRLNDAGALTTRRAQELLELLGYNPGPIDGVYGRQTKAAIESFQREEGVSADGLLSRELSSQLANALARRVAGRDGQEEIARHVVILVVEATQGAASETEAVSDAAVRLSGDRGFERVQLTNERGRIELAAVPVGVLNIDVRRNGDGLGFTSRLQITEEPRQHVLITLPPREEDESAQRLPSSGSASL